jgi:hypothetical protein
MSLWRLIAYKLKIALSGFLRGEVRKRIARIITAAAILAAVVLFAVGAYEFFAVLKSVGGLGPATAAAMVTLTFHAILVIALLFDIATTANIFFLSSDLGFLMAVPLPTLRVFALKYLEAMVSASFVALFIAFPIMIGYGLAFDAGPIFYPAAVVVTAIFLTIPVSIGTICGMVISRYVSAGRMREMLALLTGIIGLGVWIGFQMLRPSMASPGQTEALGARIEALATGGTGHVLKALPSRFPAEILTSLASAKSSLALRPLLSLVAIAGVMLAASIVVAERMYLAGWTRAVPAARKAKRSKPTVVPPVLWRWLPSTERSIVATTIRLFLRDPQQITPIAMITIMMAVFPFLMGRSAQATGLRPVTFLYSIAALSFVGSMNLAMSAAAIDGRAFWHLMVAPSSSRRKLAAKLLVPISFFIPLGAAIALGVRALGLGDWLFVVRSLWLAACLATLGSSLGLLIGISYADWEWDIPKRMIRTSGRLILTGVLGIFFAGAALGLKAFSPIGKSAGRWDASWVALLAVAVVAGALSYILLLISSRKMDRMEWKV